MRLFKRDSEQRVDAVPETQAGIATGNPIPTHWDALIKRLDSDNRAKTIFIGILMGALAASVTVNIDLSLRLSKRDIRLVRFGDPTDRVYILEPGQITGSDRDLLIRQAVRDYVIKRESIDHTTEAIRDNWLRLFTDPAWWKVFQEFVSPNNPQNPRLTFAKNLLAREIQPLYITQTPGTNTFQVFFLTVDRRGGQMVSRKEWVATMNVVTRGMIFQGQDYDQNPLGITIANYDIRTRYAEDQPK